MISIEYSLAGMLVHVLLKEKTMHIFVKILRIQQQQHFSIKALYIHYQKHTSIRHISITKQFKIKNVNI